jgi:hypothetical protein
MSLIPDVILRPVSAMTSKCGFPLTHQVTPEAATEAKSSLPIASTPPPLLSTKTAKRDVSSASTAADDSHDTEVSPESTLSEEEICWRMAMLGKAAKRAGRHVLVNGRLVLSQ